MVRRIFLDCVGLERIVSLECEHRFVLGPVILVDAANVLHQRSAEDEEQEEREAHDAVDQIEEYALAENRVDALQFRGRE